MWNPHRMTVVGIEKMQYRLDANDPWEDVTETLYVPLDAEVEFRAIPAPAGVELPEGYPTWGGAAAGKPAGDIVSVTFDEVSETAEDYKIVIVECGNTKTANLIVFEIGFDNVWNRNLPRLDENDNLTDYDKCIAVELDDGGELDLVNEDFLRIQPADLPYQNIDDVVGLEVAHLFFDSANIVGTVLNYDNDDPTDLDIYAFGIHITMNADDSIVDRLVIVIFSADTNEEYNGNNGWVANNPVEPDWLGDLPPVYSALGDNDGDPEPEDCENDSWEDNVSERPQSNNYHYNAGFEMRSREIAGGHGHQACYYDDGTLIQATWDSNTPLVAAAGTADREHPGLIPIDHART